MTLYTLLVLGIALWHGGLDYATWKALFASPTFKIATFLSARSTDPMNVRCSPHASSA